MTVAISSGRGRKGNVARCLELIRSEVEEKLLEAGRVLVKPNMVTVRRQLAATHRDTLDAVLKFLRSIGDIEILVGEIPAIGSAEEGYRNYRYHEVCERYGAKLVDPSGECVEVRVFDSSLGELRAKASKLMLETPIISVAPAKTHDTVLVTLSLKNVAVGMLLKGEKQKIHQGYKAINLSIFRLSRLANIMLAVVDGYEAMEGEGPVSGTPVKWGVCVAGTSGAQVDSTVAWMMGVNPRQVGYLSYYEKLKLETLYPIVEVRGDPPEEHRRQFKLHPTHVRQLDWKLTDEEMEKVKPVLLDPAP